MHPRPIPLGVAGLVLAAALGLSSASAQRQAAPTYSGPVRSGGSITLVLRADRTAITRIVLKGVTMPCGKISSTTKGKILIRGGAFSLSGGMAVKGKFNAAMSRATGTLAYKDYAMPSCSMPPTKWSASRK